MAGVYIKGMEMPKDEYSYTEIQIWGDGKVCTREGVKLIWGKSAIEVPDHGDLIDRSQLEEDGEWDEREDSYVGYSRAQIHGAPAAIPGDAEEAR